MILPRHCVYILRSDVSPERHYVGLTNDVRSRLIRHNTGPSGVTRFARPAWVHAPGAAH